MKIENLIQIVQNLLDVNAVDFEFKVYDSLKMDNVQLDVNKVNGLARITTGSIDPILNLGQSSATMVVEFIYPYERLEAVRETLLAVSQNSAGLVVPNNTLDANLTGSTGVIISYPTQGNYFNGTMGETARSRLICYFDINEKSVLSNDIKLSIQSGYKETNTELKGDYYKRVDSDYVKVKLPKDYEENTIYYYRQEAIIRLPERYKELEYIVGNGANCFDTGIQNRSGLTFEMKFIPTIGTSGAPTSGLAGAVGAQSNNIGLYITRTDNAIGLIYGGLLNVETQTNCWTKDVEMTVRCEFENGSQKLYIDDVLQRTATFAGDVSSNDHIYMMGTNGLFGQTQMKFQEGKILEGDVLLGHYIPCKDSETQEIGVYDLVSDSFLVSLNPLYPFTGGNEIGYVEVNSLLQSDATHLYYKKVNNKYTKVNLPADYTLNTIYYFPTWENVPYYKYIITRHRLSTTNKYNNNKEMQTVNDGQSIDFSLAVPSIKGSVINSIKDDMLTGDNIGKTFTFRVIEEDGADNPKYFENMIASGDFSYEIVPGNVLLFKILFVYKRM